MKLKISGPAKRDLGNIAEWIAASNPVRAGSFVRELQDAFEGLVTFPEAFVPIGIFEMRNVRRKPYGNYLIFYRVTATQVEILRVLHGSQDYSDLF